MLSFLSEHYGAENKAKLKKSAKITWCIFAGFFVVFKMLICILYIVESIKQKILCFQ